VSEQCPASYLQVGPGELAHVPDQNVGGQTIDVTVVKVLSKPEHVEEVAELYAVDIAESNKP
jgi:hypothetical protein